MSTEEYYLHNHPVYYRVAKCLNELIESGIDEDAHWRGGWTELSTSELEKVISDIDCLDSVMNELRGSIIINLINIIDARKSEERK